MSQPLGSAIEETLRQRQMLLNEEESLKKLQDERVYDNEDYKQSKRTTKKLDKPLHQILLDKNFYKKLDETTEGLPRTEV